RDSPRGGSDDPPSSRASRRSKQPRELGGIGHRLGTRKVPADVGGRTPAACGAITRWRRWVRVVGPNANENVPGEICRPCNLPERARIVGLFLTHDDDLG